MAEASACRMRLLEYRDIGGGILGDLPGHIKAASPQLLALHIIGTPADVAGFSEISAPTNILGVSTAVANETISSAAGDNLTAGADLQKINGIGINESDKLVNVEQSMDPTDGTTFVLHTDTWKEIFHAFGIAWGTTGKDAVGQIDVRKIDDTILVSIPAADNESNGAQFLIPDGHVGMLFGGTLTRLVGTNDEGNRIRIIYTDTIDAIGVDGLHSNWIDLNVNGINSSYTIIPKGHMFKSGTRIKFQHSSLVNLGEEYSLEVNFLIWKK